MLAYEFYRRDGINGDHLIGILPERRRDPKRITRGSIMKWVRNVVGNGRNIDHIFFIKVTLDETLKK
jgi:hypothetical protein